VIGATPAEIHAAAATDHDGPLTQDQADTIAVILAPHTQAPGAAS